MQIIAHRGAHREKSEENTPRAFHRAAIYLFPMLELDARLTKDDCLVTHHDQEIHLHGRQVKIRDHLFLDLVTDGVCTNEPIRFVQSGKIPSLEMVLDFFLHQIDINIELKEKGSGRVLADLLNKIPNKYSRFESGEILKKLVISSFEESELIVVKKFYPQLETALLLSNFCFPISSVNRKKLDRLRRFGVNAVHLPQRKATKDVVDYLKHKQGFAVRVYTVNDLAVMYNCHNAGVDGVFTDKMEMLEWMMPAKDKKPISQSVSV